jgi:hypothetical protein
VSDLPLACRLGPAELERRAEGWRALIDGWLIDRDAIPGGVRLMFEGRAGVADAIEELLRLEAECCPWMQGRLRHDDQRLLVELTADDPEAAGALVDLFRADPASTG